MISDTLLDRSDQLLDAAPDDHLVGLAQSGQEAAFAAIVRRYEPELLAQARRLGSDGRTEDAVQQAFLNAFAALQAGSEIHHLRGWLHRILRHVIVKAHVPADAPLEAASVFGESLEETVLRRAQARATLVELSALPDRQRDALLGTAVLGFPRAQVARRMGLSEGAVRQLVHRARLRLRQAATALVPFPVVRLFGAARTGGGATASEAALGAGAAASGGLAIKVGALVASGVVATGVAVTNGFPGRHPHLGAPPHARPHTAPAGRAGRLSEAPAIGGGATSAAPVSLTVALGRVTARHDHGASGRSARLHDEARGRGGAEPGRGRRRDGNGRDSGARGEQGSGQPGRGEDAGPRGSAADNGGRAGPGSTLGRGQSGADSGGTASQNGGSGSDGSSQGRDGTQQGGDGASSEGSTSPQSRSTDGASVGTDTTSAGGSDGSASGSDGSGGGSDGVGSQSGTSGGTTTSDAQQMSEAGSGSGATSGSGDGQKDSGGSRDVSGSLDSSSS
ncbi:MAG TPA: sigma-70 family RNA polymerase sigma factor [Solirubrobacteraceae bacterium]